MQINRLAQRPHLSRKEFAHELSRSGFPADEWKLGRWESGDHRIKPGAGVAMDHVLGSDGPVITSAFAYLDGTPMRIGRPGRAAPLGSLTQREFDVAFERLLAGRGSGSDWFNVLADPRVRRGAYLPPSVWSRLTAQLCGELSRAVGPALALRKRSVALLMGQGNGHVFAAFRDFVGRSQCQALASATLNLVNGRGPDYNDLSIEALGHPDRGGSWGAMHAVAAKLALGHFRSGDIPRIESKMLSIIARGPLNDGGEALLRALPMESQLRVANSVKNGQLLLQSLRTLQPLAAGWNHLVRSLAQRARDALGGGILNDDSMLEALIAEGMLHPHFEGRDAARITLMASPYRSPLAEHAIEMLPNLPADQQVPVGEFLVFLVDESHRDSLAKLATLGISPTIDEYAYLALGRIAGDLTETARAAIRGALVGPPTAATRGAIYTLGMHGELESEREALARLDHPLVGECWKSQGRAIFR